jgi:hypothetical protein
MYFIETIFENIMKHLNAGRIILVKKLPTFLRISFLINISYSRRIVNYLSLKSGRAKFMITLQTIIHAAGSILKANFILIQ